MKRTPKKIAAGIILILCSSLIFTACRHHSKGEYFFDYVVETLDLTTVQAEKLDTIRAEIMEQVELMHGERQEMRETMKAQLLADTIDKSVIESLIDDHREKKMAIVELALDKLIDFHGDLTPEQKEKLVAKIEKFEKHRPYTFKH